MGPGWLYLSHNPIVGIEVGGGTEGWMSMETHEVRVDDRGRVVIPSEMREHVGSPSHFIARLTDDGTVELVPAQVEPLSGE